MLCIYICILIYYIINFHICFLWNSVFDVALSMSINFVLIEKNNPSITWNGNIEKETFHLPCNCKSPETSSGRRIFFVAIDDVLETRLIFAKTPKPRFPFFVTVFFRLRGADEDADDYHHLDERGSVENTTRDRFLVCC